MGHTITADGRGDGHRQKKDNRQRYLLDLVMTTETSVLIQTKNFENIIISCRDFSIGVKT